MPIRVAVIEDQRIVREILEAQLGREADIEVVGGASTGEEGQVLSLIAEGYRPHEIAARLNISAATVDTHRRNIMRKPELHSIAELTKFAVRAGLSSL